MNDQHYKNHSRILVGWHVVIPSLIVIAFVFALINFLHSDMDGADIHKHLPQLVIPIALLLIWFYARRFALYAQDRAIRAEENLRHFILTGKPLDKQLELGQIIALRFASDEEMPTLAKRAITENLSPKQVKQAVQHWRPDHHRV